MIWGRNGGGEIDGERNREEKIEKEEKKIIL